jgi:hypothetical protein
MLFYLKGDYSKARRLLERAFRYLPALEQEHLSQAYLGLTLYRTGAREAGLDRLHGLLEKLRSHLLANGELVDRAIHEIEEISNGNTA